ncbi:hypothetical protein CP532_5050 [Ophiocordyceps camponoti-leonardi (nom. inval.)]|nr:hypothetical protein CP532_5050 [Ophiocordyceps camponoti-leonardi (nom. inval.)]
MLPNNIALWLVALGSAAVAPVAADHIAVTGVQGDFRRSVPLRLNINDLQARGGPAWDLYLLSLLAMYETNPSNPESFFQIAGIHGKPYREWDNTGPQEGDGWAGYCPHGEKIFLTWHRPYLALYEQTLIKHAKRLAATYPQQVRAQYQQAADNLRIPYWDWAAQQEVPGATVPSRVRVNSPTGSKQIDNPLSTFKYPRSALTGQFGAWDNRPQIFHCPSPYKYPDSANSNLQSRPYKQWIYDALTRSRSFDEFASPEGGGVGLEQVHNAVHWDGSCGGQFLALDYTAFDPLFMMHHCNADRMWALWSAMNPGSVIFNGTYVGGSRFSTPGGTEITPDSPLQPFFQTNGRFHTSRSVSSIKPFGYSYEGLEYWAKSEATMRQDTVRLVNRLYSPTSFSSGGMMASQRPEIRYFVNLELDMAQVPRPCQVNVMVDGKYAGNMVVMSQPGKGIMKGGFSIDKATREAGLNRLPREEAVKKIQAAIKVVIVKGDGSTMSIDKVPSFKLELESINYTPAKSDTGLPKFDNAKMHSVDLPKLSKLL